MSAPRTWLVEPDYLSSSGQHELRCPHCSGRLFVALSASVVISEPEPDEHGPVAFWSSEPADKSTRAGADSPPSVARSGATQDEERDAEHEARERVAEKEEARDLNVRHEGVVHHWVEVVQR